MLLSLFFILGGLIEPFELISPKVYKYLSACGFFLQAIFFSKLFWYKNTVQWNDKGIIIRIKSFFGKSLKFDKIKAIELNEKKLIVTKIDGQKVLIDLKEIPDSDTKKLNDIMVENTIANHGRR